MFHFESHVEASLLLMLLHLIVLTYVCWTKRQEPSEALFWLLIVALLPPIGIVLYLFFGITRVDRADWMIRAIRGTFLDERGRRWREERQKVARRLEEFTSDTTIANAPPSQTLDRLFPDTLLLKGNHVELLRDGSSVYPRMLEDIRAAKSSIRLQSFIFMSDEVGKRMLNALEEKAREGVDVKVLFDSVGCFKSYFSRFFRKYLFSRIPNFQLQAFSRLNLLMPWKFQLRNHRKLLVIDGRVAYSGGINIAAENERASSIPRNRYIHDLHCRITGPAVSQFTESFFRDWSYTTRQSPGECYCAGDFHLPECAGNTTLRVVAGGPGDHYQGTRKLFFAAASTARRSLTIMTPYLVPGSSYIEALCMAAARGVEVRIIVPEHNNHFYVDMAAQNSYPTLLRSGVRIFRKTGIFSHTKALLVDNEWGFMGSSNCDSRSFRLNFELDFCFGGGDFLQSMCEQVRLELADSTELLLFQAESRPVWRQFLSGCCALLTPIL